MIEKIIDVELPHKPYIGLEGVYGIEAFKIRMGHVVVILTELLHNEGKSITNASEEIATLAMEHLRHSNHLTPGRVIWIERYPGEIPDQETLEWITYKWTEKLVSSEIKYVATDPSWHPVSRQWIEELIDD